MMSDAPPAGWGGPPAVDPTKVTVEYFDKARDQSRVDIQALKELLQAEIRALSNLVTERIKGLEDRIDRDEELRKEQKLDVKERVDAALVAQKEQQQQQVLASEKAISKSETNTSELLAKTEKQVAELSTTLTDKLAAAVKTLDDKIAVVDTRVNDLSRFVQ